MPSFLPRRIIEGSVLQMSVESISDHSSEALRQSFLTDNLPDVSHAEYETADPRLCPKIVVKASVQN